MKEKNKLNKVFLNSYLKKNLGDDLFIKIISDRYKNMFYSYSFFRYKKLNKNVKIYGCSILKIFNKIIRVITKEKVSLNTIIGYNKSIHINLGGSIFIQDDRNIEQIRKNLKRDYYNNRANNYTLGCNVGPYKTQEYLQIIKNEIFSKNKDVCFREKKSYDMFNDLKNVRYESDIVFSLNNSNYTVDKNKKVVISIIDLINNPKLKEYMQQYENFIIKLIEKFEKDKYEIVLMSFCKSEGDERAIKRILKKYNTKNNIRIHKYKGNINKAIEEISTAEIIIATRFHAMILGLVFNKKVLPIIYSDKMINVLKDIKFNGIYIRINDIPSSIPQNLDSNYIENLEKVRESANKQFYELDKILEKEGKNSE